MMTTQFIKAIVTRDVAKCTTILQEYGRDISLETRDKTGKTMLMIAAQSGSDDICRMVIKAGASPTGTKRLMY
jgi:radical SAM superfamily enzyme YgiQ (UPF0313 family)